MYRIPEKVPEFEKFDMVFGGKLNRQNRWVILAELIPWDKVEENYAQLFVTNNGRPALPVRVALGALIVKEKKKILYEELLEDIKESPYNESQDLKTQIERYKARYGHYPEAVCADKIYRTRENLR